MQPVMKCSSSLLCHYSILSQPQSGNFTPRANSSLSSLSEEADKGVSLSSQSLQKVPWISDSPGDGRCGSCEGRSQIDSSVLVAHATREVSAQHSKVSGLYFGAKIGQSCWTSPVSHLLVVDTQVTASFMRAYVSWGPPANSNLCMSPFTHSLKEQQVGGAAHPGRRHMRGRQEVRSPPH